MKIACAARRRFTRAVAVDQRLRYVPSGARAFDFWSLDFPVPEQPDDT